MTRKADVVPPGFSFRLRLFTKKRETSLYQIRLFAPPPSLGTSALKLLSSYVDSIPNRNLFSSSLCSLPSSILLRVTDVLDPILDTTYQTSRKSARHLISSPTTST